MHSHAHGDSHCHDGGTARRLKWSSIATALFVVVEVAGGLKAGSLALLSDAGHNVTDAMALIFTWFAFYVQSKPANHIKTYGYHRTGVLAAFINVANDTLEQMAFVLDDMHLIDDPAVLSALTFLIDHLPPTVHIVLAGRAVEWWQHADRGHDAHDVPPR